MKISDEEILDLIWDETLSKITRKTFIRYIGNCIGTYDVDVIRKDEAIYLESFAALTLSDIKSGSTLCRSQLRWRINQLLLKGDLVKIQTQSFMFPPEKLRKVAILAIKCWQAAGLPYGFDEINKCARCLPAENVDLFTLSKNCYLILRTKYPSYKVEG